MRRVARAAVLLTALVAAFASTASAAPDNPTILATPAIWTTETSAAFEFTSVGFSTGFECRLDGGGANWAECATPTTYSSLAEGEHTFQVRALDGSDESAPSTFTWTIDLTAPGVPTNIVAEATSSYGAIVTFAASDNLDPSPALVCSQAPGSVFPLGETAVSCIATDAAGNTTTGDFTVTVRDTTPPVLTAHADVIVGQQSPQGAVVTFALPSVQDAADPSPAVACSPTSGSVFPLGDTTVACVATDAAGLKSAQETFKVVVQAGPVPTKPRIETTVPHLTRRADAVFELDLESGVDAQCKLDGPSGAGSFAPCPGTGVQTYTGLADGSYLFTVQVTNSIGNLNQASYAWVVDRTPPAAVYRFAARAAPRRVTLSWVKPIDTDYARVRIVRKRGSKGTWKLLAERTTAHAYVDLAVVKHVLYRYRIASVDRAGNRSAWREVMAWPSPIVSPRYLQVVHSPPLVDWVSKRAATYYNMQAWRDGRKILSVWPARSQYRLRSSWTYAGRRQLLSKGRVTIYVWPGFGPKSAVRYGSLYGRTAFVVG